MENTMTTGRFGEDTFEDWLREVDPAPQRMELEVEMIRAMEATEQALERREPRRARGVPQTLPAGPVAVFAVVPAPWGPLHVAASEQGVVAIELASETSEFAAGLERRLGGRVVDDSAEGIPDESREHLDDARRQLAEYFAGSRSSFDLPVDLRGVSDWDRLVLSGAVRLSFGEVTSYGGLARLIGKPRAARAVGGALGRNPIPIVIPCHRIVASDGTLGGYGGGGHGSRQAMLSVKRTLLRLESAPVALGS